MNKFYFAVMLALCFIALVCGALWTSGHAWWIAVVVLVVAALVCSFMAFLSAQGSSRADADDAFRFWLWTVVLFVLALAVGAWI